MAGTTSTTVIESALTKEPIVTPLILDILSKLSYIDFYDSLIELLKGSEGSISSENYAKIVEVLGTMQKSTAAKLNVIDFLFDILNGEISLYFSTDDHFYFVVSRALSNLIEVKDQKQLKSSILSYLADNSQNSDIEDMIRIAQKI